MYMGQFASSRLHLEEVLALYDPISHHSVIHRTGDDPHVVSLAFLAIVLFCLGFPDQAMVRSTAAIAAARTLAHPTSLAVSLNAAARLCSLVGDNAALGQRVAELISLATEQGFAHWRGVGTIYRGWLRANNGNVTEGISPAPRFYRSPRHRCAVSETVSYRLARQSTRDRRAD
jgi:predicted ATPase